MTITKTSLKDLINMALVLAGEPIVTTVASVTTGNAYIALNHVDNLLKEINRAGRFPFNDSQTTSMTTTAGTRSYALPDEVDETAIDLVQILNHATANSADLQEALVFLPYDTWASLYEFLPDTSVATADRGYPSRFTLFQRKIYLAPVPDTNPNNSNAGYSLLIHHRARTGRISRADATTLFIPLEYEDMLIKGIAARMLRPKNLQLSLVYEAEYKAALADMLSSYAAGTPEYLGV